MRGFGVLGLIALTFGLGSYYATGRLGPFGFINLGLGAAVLLASGLHWLRRSRGLGSPEGRRLLVRHATAVALALAAGVALTVVADRSGCQRDLTIERRFELAPATKKLLASLPQPATAILFHDPGDPRARRTRLLLDVLARAGPLRVRERELDEASDEAERYEVTSSNTVVLALGHRFETVERPSEGTLYAALRRLLAPADHLLLVAEGEGEGNLRRLDPAGFSLLASALESEGYRLKSLVLPAVRAIPQSAAALVVVCPKRRFRAPSLEAIDTFLANGGRLLALLEPGVETGLEALLERWGFGLPDALVVDPVAGPLEDDPPGVDPIAFHYSDHPVVQGLGPTRMAFFRHARPVHAARKPRPDDRLRELVFTSPQAWALPDPGPLAPVGRVEPPDGARRDYQPLAAAGAYRRDGRETRIVVFGDSDFASNRYLRSLYNLDLVLNAVHWLAEREQEITIRPKVLPPNQAPLTPQQSLRMFYGVGLLLPEICLLAAAALWLRSHRA